MERTDFESVTVGHGIERQFAPLSASLVFRRPHFRLRLSDDSGSEFFAHAERGDVVDESLRLRTVMLPHAFYEPYVRGVLEYLFEREQGIYSVVIHVCLAVQLHLSALRVHFIVDIHSRVVDKRQQRGEFESGPRFQTRAYGIVHVLPALLSVARQVGYGVNLARGDLHDDYRTPRGRGIDEPAAQRLFGYVLNVGVDCRYHVLAVYRLHVQVAFDRNPERTADFLFEHPAVRAAKVFVHGILDSGMSLDRAFFRYGAFRRVEPRFAHGVGIFGRFTYRPFGQPSERPNALYVLFDYSSALVARQTQYGELLYGLQFVVVYGSGRNALVAALLAARVSAPYQALVLGLAFVLEERRHGFCKSVYPLFQDFGRETSRLVVYADIIARQRSGQNLSAASEYVASGRVLHHHAEIDPFGLLAQTFSFGADLYLQYAQHDADSGNPEQCLQNAHADQNGAFYFGGFPVHDFSTRLLLPELRTLPVRGPAFLCV